jgi:putative membrane protein
MHFLASLVLAVLTNLAGLLAAAHYIVGFSLITSDWKLLLEIALGFTLLNLILRPLLKLFLGPLIVLTLGLGMILVNAAVLLVLDFLTPALSISGIAPLIEATLLMAAINFVVDLFVRI